MTLRIEATGYRDTRRVVNENGECVYLIQEYCDGSWRVHDASNDAVVSGFAKTPKAALKSITEHTK